MRILSGVMRLSAAQRFSQLLHFSTRQRKEEDVTASLSLWWNSIGASEPISAGGIFALGNSVGKTVGFKDRGLGRGHFVTHSSLCLFVTSPLFLTLLVVSDSLPLLQKVPPIPQCHISSSTDLARAIHLPPFCYFLSPSCSLSSAMVDHSFLVFID